MTNSQKIKATAARYELIELIHARDNAPTEGVFNAMTVQILRALAKAKFIEVDGYQPPWAQIMGEVLTAIAQNAYPHPYKFDQEGGEDVLCIRTSHIMEHLSHGTWLREHWEDIPIRTDRALKKQLQKAGVVITDGAGAAKSFERTLGGGRVGHLAALRLSEMHRYGLGTFAATQGVSQITKP